MSAAHVPVMLGEMLTALDPRDGGAYLDGTFGRGGYTRAILDAADCTMWSIDRDPEAIERGQALIRDYPGRLTLLHGRFGEMTRLLESVGISRLDGIVLDLGVSSPQLDDGARGFSFRANGPLDMRMAGEGPTAADVVNTLDETSLAEIIRQLGEERHARRVARAIVAARTEQPIDSTARLARIVRDVVPKSKDGVDPATRTFMALRIHVNDELGELERGLVAAEALLRPGGRLVVVCFHSLEDRRVKIFFRDRGGAAPRASRHAPDPGPGQAASFQLIRRRGVTPGADEIAANPRARSARLRAGERTDAPPLEVAA